MPKAIETPTTHRSAPAAAPIALPAKVAAAPPDDALARMLWSGSELDEVWERRDPTNKRRVRPHGRSRASRRPFEDMLGLESLPR